jgi:hypothetical protein
MPIPSTLRWFAQCALSAATLLFACGLATAWFSNGRQLSSVPSNDEAMNNFNRYCREAIPDVVLVGSSLTYRLREEYFDTPKLRNLAIAGGSPVTGLAIIAKQRRLPKLVVVETNILNRPVDASLVEKFSEVAPSPPDPLFFRPVETAVAAYEEWRHALPSRKEVAAAMAQLIKQPPSDFDNGVYLDRAIEAWNAEEPSVATRASVKSLEELIAAIEQRGARVLLYEMPISHSLERTRYGTITHKIVRDKFPDTDRWLRYDYPRSELRWSDGSHLDRRSAGIVARAIDKILFQYLNPA